MDARKTATGAALLLLSGAILLESGPEWRSILAAIAIGSLGVAASTAVLGRIRRARRSGHA